MKDSIHDILAAPWKNCVVSAAVRLKVFTVLSEGAMTAGEIASKCGAVPRLLKALLDACVGMGLITSQNEKYTNSQFSRAHFVEGEPQYVGDFIELLHDESRQWARLYDIILGSSNEAEGQDTSEFDHRTFTKAMNNIGMLGEAEALGNSVDLSGCTEMVDAGGGSGLYSVVLCKRYPELRSTILDTRDTLVITEEMISGFKERERITLRQADITKESFGEDIDVVLLSDVIYDESTAAPILKNAWDCLRQNGVLIIRGYYSDPEDSNPLFGALFVLNQIVFDPSRGIVTISSLRKKVQGISFTITRTSRLRERSFLLIAKKQMATK